ncbi:stage III sporulation protein AF [Cohnella sp. CFH 77786]|uniref:stage III sporulation protein AF n=1 Tax=Cohnella sp. CFH 77786 TaxID=2662265 RepID=UPI002102D9F9|nr:stage III sporulation protein AF [Cohnella sp. CFH 77786]
MEGLSGWLKQIVAVVLLAGIVDLLLPNRTMQRYVRLVAGLFVLLTIATPLLQWVRSDFGSKLADGLVQTESASQASAGELDRIQAEGRKWRERQQEEAAGVVAARLQEAIRADVERSEGRKVGEVLVQVERSANGLYEVRDVTVTLTKQPAGADANAQASPEPAPVAKVEPVAPVIVESPQESRSEGRNETDTAEPDRETRGRVASLIAARYGIPEERVQVVEAEPADNRR